MKDKEKFKEFVKTNPSLINHVTSKEHTWQEFYELYSLYGDEEKYWEPYIKKNDERSTTSDIQSASLGSFFSNVTFKDIFGYIKTIDLDNLKTNMETIQKGLGIFQDFTKTRNTSNNTGNLFRNNSYQPRARGRFFDD